MNALSLIKLCGNSRILPHFTLRKNTFTLGHRAAYDPIFGIDLYKNLSHNFRSFPLQKSWMHMMEFRQSALEEFGNSDFYSASSCYNRPKRGQRGEFWVCLPKVKRDFNAQIKKLTLRVKTLLKQSR